MGRSETHEEWDRRQNLLHTPGTKVSIFGKVYVTGEPVETGPYTSSIPVTRMEPEKLRVRRNEAGSWWVLSEGEGLTYPFCDWRSAMRGALDIARTPNHGYSYYGIGAFKPWREPKTAA